MSTLSLVLLLLISAPLQLSSLPLLLDSVKLRAMAADLILSAIERATIFLGQKQANFKINNLMCFKILQVELEGFQEALGMDPVLQPVSQRAGKVSKMFESLLNSGIHFLYQKEPTRVQEFLPIISSGFWKLPQSWTQTNASLVFNILQLPDSQLQDPKNQCIRQLLGTRANDNQTCSYSPKCETLVTWLGGSDFYVHRQMFYFLVSKMLGCTEGLFHQTQHFIDLFCANMMDLNENTEASQYTYSIEDIFMKNIMLCGLAGHSNFYKARWLNDILSWQNLQNGCFVTSDTCSVHRTAVAVGALGGFLYVIAKHPILIQDPPNALHYQQA